MSKEIVINEKPNSADNEVRQEHSLASNTTSSTTDNSHSSQLSSQRQLLGLARQFAIDGALIAQDKVMPIEDRVFKRAKASQVRKQENLEAIIHKAIQYCSDSQVTDRADKDWFNHFIELAEQVSNKTMQELWAKILAGEINSPGSFSYKALKAFNTMSIHDAKLFGKVCQFAVADSHGQNRRLISGASQSPGLFNFFTGNQQVKTNLASIGLGYGELLALADNHLLFVQETETTPLKKEEVINLHYQGKGLILQAAKTDCILSYYKFSPIGNELARLIGDKPQEKYVSQLTQELSQFFNVKLT